MSIDLSKFITIEKRGFGGGRRLQNQIRVRSSGLTVTADIVERMELVHASTKDGDKVGITVLYSPEDKAIRLVKPNKTPTYTFARHKGQSSYTASIPNTLKKLRAARGTYLPLADHPDIFILASEAEEPPVGQEYYEEDPTTITEGDIVSWGRMTSKGISIETGQVLKREGDKLKLKVLSKRYLDQHARTGRNSTHLLISKQVTNVIIRRKHNG